MLICDDEEQKKKIPDPNLPCGHSEKKEFKKAGRGNKSKAAVALTDEEIDLLYENNMFGMRDCQ